MMYIDRPSHVHLQTEMEGLHAKPSARGQQEVVHDSRHNFTAHRVIKARHIVVDQKSQVEQEDDYHQVHKNGDGIRGLGLPVRRDRQFRKLTQSKLCS